VSALLAALDYARSGLLVFPAPPGTKMSFKSARNNGGRRWGATRDEEEIKRDWERWPNANVCIVTGEVSGVFVTETDNKADVNGDAVLAAWQRKKSVLPFTRKARSPSGSIHWYWRWPGGELVIRNDVGRKIGPGVDVRGEGGMVVAPPSVRHDGIYQWLNDAPIANAPLWLIDLVAELPVERREEEWGSDPALVAAAAAVIPTELSWHERNRIGMAIWCATNGEGFEIWDEWLQRSGKYDRGHALARWRGISSSRPTNIGMGTLVYHANRVDPGWLERYDNELVNALNGGSYDG
jgi:Bifunctional DNA primase/polymerase, N-terminal/Primase C terminal 2 (PriCT-2)